MGSLFSRKHYKDKDVLMKKYILLMVFVMMLLMPSSALAARNTVSSAESAVRSRLALQLLSRLYVDCYPTSRITYSCYWSGSFVIKDLVDKDYEGRARATYNIYTHKFRISTSRTY